MEDCRKLSNKVAIIAGASTGMGLATPKRFVQEGMDHVERTPWMEREFRATSRA
jgi:NAD(P)-dependent dehydrogenase (short-subunit alcohol dehydrogenase family)